MGECPLAHLLAATVCVARDDAPGAARLVAAVLESAPAGNGAWLLPIEPLLHVQGDHAVWAGVLAVLRARAS